MKCLSLWQPWASLIVLGTKKIETRSWETKYRGTILIHAAKHFEWGEIKYIQSNPCFHAALHKVGGTRLQHTLVDLPRGAIVGRVDIVDCKPTDSFSDADLDKRHSSPDSYYWTERELGDFAMGRFGWVLENPVVFDDPIPYKGHQRLFEVDESALKEVASVQG